MLRSLLVVPAFTSLVVALVASGCAANAPKPIPKAPAGSCATPSETVSGALEGTKCGNLTAHGNLSIAQGKKLVLGPGTVLTMESGAGIAVDGELDVQGTKDQPVIVTAADDWGGWNIDGTLTATFLQSSGHLASMIISGGTVSLTDSVVDLEAPSQSPDCIPVGGGTLTFDHTKVTGCHCPLHVGGADQITITHSILDGADPIMVTGAKVSIHDSAFAATEFDLYDLGGNITPSFVGNYYGGGAPSELPPGDAAFGDVSQFSTTPLTDVGPHS